MLLKVPLNNAASEDYIIAYDGPGKFFNDNVYINNDKYLILIDGVILNRAELLSGTEYDWKSFIEYLYEKKGERFFSLLKGSYYGFVYSKKEHHCIVFTDHIGTKPIYYSKSSDCICISDDFMVLVNDLKAKGETLTLSEESAYLILTYGYLFEDKTIVNEIKRLHIGYYGKISDSGFNEQHFYSVDNNASTMSEDDAIEGIDVNFRKAIKQAFDKDLEYGFKHLVSLSGGLDSRMTSWVGHEMGYINQLNITFSQSNYLDETIPKEIASDLKHEWLFKALDNGTFLSTLDEITEISGGNVLYYGLASNNSLYKYLDFDSLGMLHTGQLGDVALSSFYSSSSAETKHTLGDGAYSTTLLDRLSDSVIKKEYSNEEVFKFYIRGFYGANQGLRPIQRYTETYSPFYDIDFMKFTLSIPVEMRYNHSIYKKWIIKKYNAATDYVWESIRAKITDRNIIIGGKAYYLNNLPNKILRKLGVAESHINTSQHMNPIDYWLSNSEQTRSFADNYFDINISRLDGYPELKADCESLWLRASGIEKTQILTLLSAVKILLHE